MKKSNVTVICGGPSVEHEVSVRSARFICRSLNKERYDIQVIIISHEGHWYRIPDVQHFIDSELDKAMVAELSTRVLPAIGCDNASWVSLDGQQQWQTNIVIPIMHGTLGEDGSLQGILRWLKLPFVGADVLGSAICMDKGINKALLAAQGVPVAKWLLFRHEELATIDAAEVVAQLGLPLFVKPADSGSSVGIAKVHQLDELMPAIHYAAKFSRFVLIEEAIDGREIEVAVLGNHDPMVTLPGEVCPTHEFYNYEAKYIDPNGARLEVPAELPQYVIDELQATASRAYQLLQVEGLARVDFFVTKDHQIILNEINTLPGFTAISMYPKMCEHQGIEAGDMVDRFITCAMQRFEQQSRLSYRYEELAKQEL